MINSIDIKRLAADKRSSPKTGKAALEGSRTAKPPGAEGGIWAFLNKDVHFFSSSLSDKIKESFYLELSTLLAAGVDIRGALELVQEGQTKKKDRQVFDVILQQIIAGSTLSSALADSDLFTTYEFYSVQIGEETGKLIMVLDELAVYYKKRIDQKRQIIGALTYPILVLVVAALAVTFMLSYVVPMFADVLKRFGGDLPFITKAVLRVSTFIKQIRLPLLLLLISTAGVVITQKKKAWFRKTSSDVLLRIPVIGEIIRKIYLARFSNTLSMLIGSRIPMLQAIQLVTKMIDFYPIESSLPTVEENIMSGVTLHKSLAGHAIYPKKMISLIKVGEEVNQLDLFFSKISNQYSSEVEHQTNILSKFIEPLIIVVLGLVVGVILIAMYLPLFKLGQAV